SHLATGPAVVAHYVRTYEDGLELASALSGPPKRVFVIGAGFIGAEDASSARSLGHDVTVLETLSIPLSPVLGEQLGLICASLHERNGTKLVTGVTITSIEAVGDGTSIVTLNNGTTHEADVLVIGIGVVPNTDWLKDSELPVDNGVIVDESLFATDTVMAIGDVARFAWNRLGATSLTRIEHWQVAADHGQFAATALLKGRASAGPLQLLPYFWSDQYGLKLQMLGRPEPTDEVTIALQEDDGKCLALFRRGDALSAVFGISKPKQLMGFRQPLLDGCLFDDAVKLLNP
ncbi:MAG: FAD-dependent oxidoreductase, partial [Actinomycetota bacterium]